MLLPVTNHHHEGSTIMAKQTIDRLNWLGQDWLHLHLEHGMYADGSYALQLLDLDPEGEDGPYFATVTINLSAHSLTPKPGCFWIKDDMEAAGLGDALVKAGVVETTGRWATYGPYNVRAQEYRLASEYDPREA